MNKIPFYRQLRFRIILLFSLVVFIGTAAGAFTMVQLADKQFREVLHDQFHNTISTGRELLLRGR
ncbi:hypothetical protein BOW53_03190 [Solemya pervernicosa gill symbiont]|uniref:Uncharacterized protein n=1 Tax=Solemya pervernicosa gill symbiont TaxID=642797 RepID=A0A1T2L8V1_9GAMM|nr:hypothetical protein [Solemya pervernicosa gill symbiont]OOZ41529.1 hypothetical protein BOW53_03190 [Solemya pervernicosa gill symbiont]